MGPTPDLEFGSTPTPKLELMILGVELVMQSGNRVWVANFGVGVGVADHEYMSYGNIAYVGVTSDYMY